MKTQPTKELFELIREEVRRCYQASNSFTDEDRAQLLAGARALEGAYAEVVR